MVSIILPIYQVEDYIEECINSILSQTYKEIEIICVNDCTLDNSITIVKEYMNKDNRIQLINHDENRGLGGARNTGIDAAKGEFILFVDSDDYLCSTMVEKLIYLLKEFHADASICGMMLFTDSQQTPHTTFHYDKLAMSKYYNLLENKEILTNLWPSAVNKLFRTSIIRENNIRFKERMLYEDHTFFYEYFFQCSNFSYTKEPLYYYRKARISSITSNITGREDEIFTVIKYISEIFKMNFDDVTADRLCCKISVRLLYERRWVFQENTPSFYDYLKKVSQYLTKYDKDSLLNCKDTFIYNDDPIFFTVDQIKKLNNKRLRLERSSSIKLLKKIKKQLKKFPFFYTWTERKRKSDELYWATWSTLKRVESIENKIDNQMASRIDPQLNTRLEENIFNRLYILQQNVNSVKQKNDDIWWLSWNNKDNLDTLTNSNSSDSRFLRYYPTWIPTEYPEYFMGNTWYWADNFKRYYVHAKGDCNKEIKLLKLGMSEESKLLIDLLWERNTKIIPYSQYTDLHGMLLKTKLVFTESELAMQHEIFKHYVEYTHKYILPEKTIYEVPVFYFEHGLKTISDAEKNYIYQGDILDLGAFIGDSALILSKYTKNMVYSVEMDKENIEKMEEVLALNNSSKKIKIINCGIGECNEELSYFGKESYSTLNNVSAVADIYRSNQLVQVKNIDTLVEEYDIRPRFIKIDIEGMELEAIRGAVNTLKTYKPIMCISVYHTAKDFLFIKPFIDALNLDYTFRIENHNPFDPIYEKMLIAMPRIE